MSLIMTFGSAMPIIKVGRMAGQFAKPRSEPTETKDGVELPSYRGDIINSESFTADARKVRKGGAKRRLARTERCCSYDGNIPYDSLVYDMRPFNTAMIKRQRVKRLLIIIVRNNNSLRYLYSPLPTSPLLTTLSLRSSTERSPEHGPRLPPVHPNPEYFACFLHRRLR